MADKVRSAVAFQADGENERDAKERVLDALKEAGFEVARVTGVSRLIDYLPGEFLVHTEIDHEVEDAAHVLARSGRELHDKLTDAGLKPRTNGGALGVAPGDSRLESAVAGESKLLDGDGRFGEERDSQNQLFGGPVAPEHGTGTPETTGVDYPELRTKPEDSVRDAVGDDDVRPADEGQSVSGAEADSETGGHSASSQA